MVDFKNSITITALKENVVFLLNFHVIAGVQRVAVLPVTLVVLYMFLENISA